MFVNIQNPGMYQFFLTNEHNQKNSKSRDEHSAQYSTGILYQFFSGLIDLPQNLEN